MKLINLRGRDGRLSKEQTTNLRLAQANLNRKGSFAILKDMAMYQRPTKAKRDERLPEPWCAWEIPKLQEEIREPYLTTPTHIWKPEIHLGMRCF